MIFISAGHYPARPGARSGKIKEHDEAVTWVSALCERLGPLATEVPTGTLREKCRFINFNGSSRDCAIEIHFNSFKIWEDLNRDGLVTEDELTAAGKGCETLYYPGSLAGRLLAEICQNAMKDILPPDRGVKEGWYRMNPKNGPDYFLAQTRCPAVIVEPEFIHRVDVYQTARLRVVDALADALRGSGGM